MKFWALVDKLDRLRDWLDNNTNRAFYRTPDEAVDKYKITLQNMIAELDELIEKLKAEGVEDESSAGSSSIGWWTYGDGTLRFTDYYEAINHLRDHGSPSEKSRGVRAWGLP